MSLSLIHPTAVISDGATIGEGTSVGPYSVIGPKVSIGKENQIGSHVVIDGNTKIGSGNQIFQFASIGAKPQDLKFKGEDSVLEIGDKNIIREYVTLQPGTTGGGMITKIGNGNLFMACSHVGHDSIIGDGNVFANSAAVAGHVTIGNGVTVGGLVGLHQFIRIGDYALIAAGAMVPKDIPPFCLAQGDRAELKGINRIGLSRRGIPTEEITKIRKLYRQMFLDEEAKELTISARVAKLQQDVKGFKLGEQFLNFIATSERGVVFPSGRAAGSVDESTDIDGSD